MECNKDEAKRAMDIAERKITEKDYKGAKKFVIKAQNLYPNLEGLKKLLTTVEVYISADRKLAGEPDWYGIFGVDPLATASEVRRKYMSLSLTLHPDKNKFMGAEGAFKLVNEAWVVLSDSDKRSSYNELIWEIYGTYPNVPTTQTPPPPPPPPPPQHQPTSFYRSEPTVVESRPKPKPKPRGRPPKSSVAKTNVTPPSRPKPRGRPPKSSVDKTNATPPSRPKPHGRPPKSNVDKTNATPQPPPSSAANPPPPTPFYRSDPETVGETRPKPKPRGRPPKSRVDKTNGTQPTTQNAANPPPPPHDQPTPLWRYEPVILERRPTSGAEEKEWVVKRKLLKSSDRSVRTTP